MKHLIKTGFVIAFLMTLFSCENDELDVSINKPSEPYIKSYIVPDTLNPYKGIYYINIKLDDPHSALIELKLSEENPQWTSRGDTGLGMTSQGIIFRDSTTSERLEIYFHFNTKIDTSFNIRYADYFYSDPWFNVAGANVNYLIPVSNSPTNYQYNLYMGTNTSFSFFKITYIGNNRINGEFSTQMKDCCWGTSKTYNVTGDFSIPQPVNIY
jgi:hypothetical protein